MVAYRDRLARCGLDLFKCITEFHRRELMVLNEITCSFESEFTNDLLTILHVFSHRRHGLRKYKAQIKEDQDLSHG
jgi:predicted site-specific integrase-resolvase